MRPYLYILKDRTPIPIYNMLEWSVWFITANRIVAQDYVGIVKVSTVFLAMDYQFSCKTKKPLLFETMIFGGEDDGFIARYATWAGAEAGHKRILSKIKSKLFT